MEREKRKRRNDNRNVDVCLIGRFTERKKNIKKSAIPEMRMVSDSLAIFDN